MVLSNEPGYYQMSDENEGFGIRIENVVGVVERKFARGKQQFLGFGSFLASHSAQLLSLAC